MAYTTINKSSEHFNTKLYTGNASTQAITGVGFQPDLVWIKNRSTTNAHVWQDVVRGADKTIYSNATNAQDTGSTNVGSFDSDGFTLGSNGGTNGNGNNIASWNWKANGASSSNTDGTITSYVSANTTSGFSIVKWTGTSTAGTIGHGLGVAPKAIIVKSLASTEGWYSYFESLGNTQTMVLDRTDAKATTTLWQNTTPTSSVFSVSTHGAVNGSGDYIAYCFADVPGYSKIGKYTGNGNANGVFVYTGFKPAWVMIKRAVGAGNEWYVWDNKRDIDNPGFQTVYASASNAEFYSSYGDFLSNGFKLRSTSAGINSSTDYIYMAFGQSLVGSNNVPCTAR